MSVSAALGLWAGSRKCTKYAFYRIFDSAIVFYASVLVWTVILDVIPLTKMLTKFFEIH